MAKVLDVAQHVCDTLGQIDDWKLQKLTYYSQAWSLAWTGKPLVDEDFQAWKDGPVSRTLYAAKRYASKLRSGDVPGGDSQNLSVLDKAVIDAVIAFYGHWSADRLIERTHAETPWIEARGDTPAGERSTAMLSTDTMRRYYTSEMLRGGDSPTPPVLADAVSAASHDDIAQIAASEAERWKDTLDWLATR